MSIRLQCMLKGAKDITEVQQKCVVSATEVPAA